MALCILLAFLLLTSGSEADPSITLNASTLAGYQTNPLRVDISSTVVLNCVNNNVRIVNVDKTRYDNCTEFENGNVQIGHCAHGQVYLLLTPGTGGNLGSVDYHVGQTYYYVIYGHNGETQYCKDGFKFKLYINDPSDMTTSSSLIPDMVSSSNLIMPSSTGINPVSSTVPDILSTTTTTTGTVTTASTTRSTRPIVATTTSSEIKSTATDKPVRDTSTLLAAFETLKPTGVSIDGLTNGGHCISAPNVLLTSTLLLLALLLYLRLLF